MNEKLKTGDRLLLSDGYDENGKANDWREYKIVEFYGPNQWPQVSQTQPTDYAGTIPITASLNQAIEGRERWIASQSQPSTQTTLGELATEGIRFRFADRQSVYVSRGNCWFDGGCGYQGGPWHDDGDTVVILETQER